MLKYIVKYENTDANVPQGFIKKSGYNDRDNNWESRRKYTDDFKKAENFQEFCYAIDVLLYDYDDDENVKYTMYTYDTKTKELRKIMEASNVKVEQ